MALGRSRGVSDGIIGRILGEVRCAARPRYVDGLGKPYSHPGVSRASDHTESSIFKRVAYMIGNKVGTARR